MCAKQILKHVIPVTYDMRFSKTQFEYQVHPLKAQSCEIAGDDYRAASTVFCRICQTTARYQPYLYRSKQLAIVARSARSILARDERCTSAVSRSKRCHDRETQNTNTPARSAPRRTLLLNSWQAWARAARAR